MSQREFPINLEMNSGWSMITETENQQIGIPVIRRLQCTMYRVVNKGHNLWHLLWLNILDGPLLLQVNEFVTGVKIKAPGDSKQTVLMYISITVQFLPVLQIF